MITRAQLVEHLANAAESQKQAINHLIKAIEETEASRAALHDVGKECWIDQLDHENGQE